MRFSNLLLAAAVLLSSVAYADAIRQTKGDYYDAFRQLDVDLPTPNVYRAASGAPGTNYWQQRADYKISVELDEQNQQINGSETITYTNNSPDTLRYIWMQLDQNRFSNNSLEQRSMTGPDAAGRLTWQELGTDVLTYNTIARHQHGKDVDYGYSIDRVVDGDDRAMEHTIVDTMMRIDLPRPLEPGNTINFSIDWSFNILLEERVGSRGGYEYFPESDTYIYFLAQWFPRLAAYTDYTGWQHKSFLGRGEFTLEFGDYEVDITVPADHIVSASGELQNPEAVLSDQQRQRLDEARDSDTPVFIVTAEEALENERNKSNGTSTWRFKADNVRDFAWSSSRKFIWDAMIHRQNDEEVPEVLAMSFYPNEAEPVWSRYSTHAVVHTMEVYSRFSFAYPYPTSQSVNTWKSGGMEYPMITFNGYRPDPIDEADADQFVEEASNLTYSRRTKYGLIGVIIHEVGHNYFPMIVNSDERQWTWMDEGLNSFLDYIAALEWEEDYPAYGPFVNVLDFITEYMVSEDQVPIMTSSDSVLQLGPNAYSKPTAALMVLRETVMGRELFDFAFRTYAQRWMFKRPTPSDFFRTMEDASGIDLDWFWRGWFYSTDHVDVAIRDVREYQVSSRNPDIESEFNREKYTEDFPKSLAQQRNRDEQRPTYLERHPELSDFYNENDQFTPSNKDRNDYTTVIDELEGWEYEALQRAVRDGEYVYFIDFENIGGLPTPLPLNITNEDGSEEFMMIPAEIWRRDHDAVTKLMIREQPIAAIALDPRHETADADFSNNNFPGTPQKSRIELYKGEDETRDLMRDMLFKLRDRKGGEGEAPRQIELEDAN